MPRYNHDMMHCSQEQCDKKDQCYRYWLGQNLIENGFRYASFYYPEPNKDLRNCIYYLNKKDW